MAYSLLAVYTHSLEGTRASEAIPRLTSRARSEVDSHFTSRSPTDAEGTLEALIGAAGRLASLKAFNLPPRTA
jgi:hypothetical protein